MNPDRLETALHVPESLARVLDVCADHDSPRVGELREHTGRAPKALPPRGSRAIHYLVSVAVALAPLEQERRMDVPRRAETAAKQATPRDYGEAFSTLMELGWGGLRLSGLPADALPPVMGETVTVCEAGEQILGCSTPRQSSWHCGSSRSGRRPVTSRGSDDPDLVALVSDDVQARIGPLG